MGGSGRYLNYIHLTRHYGMGTSKSNYGYEQGFRLIKHVDCNEDKYWSGETMDDIDCDGYNNEEDCDDLDPYSTVLLEDTDCDSILVDFDCDDNNEASTYKEIDVDCDGILNADDPDADGDTLCDELETHIK